jgi:hypothetical protein
MKVKAHHLASPSPNNNIKGAWTPVFGSRPTRETGK